MASVRHRHRRASHRGDNKTPIWVILAVCAVVTVIVTVVIGNLLKLWLDDETYRFLTEETTAPPSNEVHQSTARDLNAYPFTAQDDPEAASENLSVSFSLNSPGGTVQYTSPVTQHQERPSASDRTLTDCVGEISTYGVYVSGVFYPQAFSHSNPDLRYAQAMEECALMREFLQTGGSEILLVGLPFATESSESILSYVQTVKTALSDATVGVALPLSVAEAEENRLFLEELITVCDFYALDMTAATVSDPAVNDVGLCVEVVQALRQIDYYLTYYDMRLLLNEMQAEWIAVAEQRPIEDYQIMTDWN